MKPNLIVSVVAKKFDINPNDLKMEILNALTAEENYKTHGSKTCLMCGEQMTYQKTYDYCLSKWDDYDEHSKRMLISFQGGIGNRSPKDPRHYYANQYAMRKSVSGYCLECRDMADAIKPAGNAATQRFFQALAVAGAVGSNG